MPLPRSAAYEAAMRDFHAQRYNHLRVNQYAVTDSIPDDVTSPLESVCWKILGAITATSAEGGGRCLTMARALFRSADNPFTAEEENEGRVEDIHKFLQEISNEIDFFIRTHAPYLMLEDWPNRPHREYHHLLDDVFSQPYARHVAPSELPNGDGD